MKIIIDHSQQTVTYDRNGQTDVIGLYTREAFETLSRVWLKIGWDQKYTYSFTWLGRPVIQLPEDLIRAQEVIYRLRPDVIIETGVAHGGSLVYYASLCQLMGKGRVIGVDIEIRPHNRRAIEAHPLSSLITLVEGNSVTPDTVAQVRSLVQSGEVTMVFLDSCHTKEHVRAELEAYHDFVSPNSYIVAADGITADLYDVPRGKPDWLWDNPAQAARDFLAQHPEFVLDEPERSFNESDLKLNVTYWPGAWMRRRHQQALSIEAP